MPLTSGISHTNLNIDIAKKLVNLPLNIGKHPVNGGEIILGIGKYGPYLKYNSKFISVPKKLDPFSLTLEQAIEVIAANSEKENKNKN